MSVQFYTKILKQLGYNLEIKDAACGHTTPGEYSISQAKTPPTHCGYSEKFVCLLYYVTSKQEQPTLRDIAVVYVGHLTVWYFDPPTQWGIWIISIETTYICTYKVKLGD